jgi:hypothetical protein
MTTSGDGNFKLNLVPWVVANVEARLTKPEESIWISEVST